MTPIFSISDGDISSHSHYYTPSGCFTSCICIIHSVNKHLLSAQRPTNCWLKKEKKKTTRNHVYIYIYIKVVYLIRPITSIIYTFPNSIPTANNDRNTPRRNILSISCYFTIASCYLALSFVVQGDLIWVTWAHSCDRDVLKNLAPKKKKKKR